MSLPLPTAADAATGKTKAPIEAAVRSVVNVCRILTSRISMRPGTPPAAADAWAGLWRTRQHEPLFPRVPPPGPVDLAIRRAPEACAGPGKGFCALRRFCGRELKFAGGRAPTPPKLRRSVEAVWLRAAREDTMPWARRQRRRKAVRQARSVRWESSRP